MAPRERLDVESGAALPLALAFEVVRRHRAGEIARPRLWLEPILGTASPQRIVAETEAQLEGKRPADLAHWVMAEMPSHEARFIDDRSDLLRAAIIGAAITSTTGSEEHFAVGPTLFSVREQVMRAFAELEQHATQIGRDFEVAEMPQRLASLRAGFERAFASYERGGREALLEDAVDTDLARQLISDALKSEWSKGFPRALLSAVGSVRIGGEWDRKIPALTVSQLELKEFFVAGSIDPSTMRMMGSAWARAFLAGETKELFRQFERSPARSWRLSSLRERILKAADVLAGRGGKATHLIGSANWHLWNALERDGSLTRNERRTDGFIGTALGLAVYEAHEELEGLVVVSLPNGVHVTQHLLDGEVFEVSVREINTEAEEELRQLGTSDAEGGPGETPSERLRLRTWVVLREAAVFRTRQDGFVRIALPDAVAR